MKKPAVVLSLLSLLAMVDTAAGTESAPTSVVQEGGVGVLLYPPPSPIRLKGWTARADPLHHSGRPAGQKGIPRPRK